MPAKEYPRDDTTIQLRAPKATDEKLNLICDQRGMVKKDLAGRIMTWFADLPYDLQSCVLGQVTDETALEILNKLRAQAEARIVAHRPEDVRRAVRSTSGPTRRPTRKRAQ